MEGAVLNTHIVKLALFIVCIASGTGCSAAVSSHSHFTRTVPTVFRNTNGATIKISTEGVLVGGRFYKSTNCSDAQYNCFTYGERVLFITPKVCFASPQKAWQVGRFVVHWYGYDPSGSSDVVQDYYGNGVGYTFSNTPGKGITAIAYDGTGSYHIAPGQNFYGNIPSKRENGMLYYSPSGPGFLPCSGKGGHG